jgi:hypothetical protein
MIYVEDRYLWGHHVGDVFTRALREHLDLHVFAVLPLHPDLEGPIGRPPHLLGRHRAMSRMVEVAPDRVALCGIENGADTPIYGHAKICIIDDAWARSGALALPAYLVLHDPDGRPRPRRRNEF